MGNTYRDLIGNVVTLTQRVSNPDLWEMRNERDEWIGAADSYDRLVTKLQRNHYAPLSQHGPCDRCGRDTRYVADPNPGAVAANESRLCWKCIDHICKHA